MPHVLDASAIITYLEDRKGAGTVERLLIEARTNDVPLLMSTVNWGEAFHSYWRNYGHKMAEDRFARLARLPLALVEADRSAAELAASLRVKHNLPYADGFAAGLALQRKAVLVADDEHFARVRSMIKIIQLA